jgi:integration host factor subunit alpha
MIKNELVEAIRTQIGGISSREVWAYITFIFDEIATALERGETVKITNFGVFETRDKKARIGRNPKTLEEAEISARKVVRFRLSDAMYEWLNPDNDSE